VAGATDRLWALGFGLWGWGGERLISWRFVSVLGLDGHGIHNFIPFTYI
jgi:hypothetical protein